MSINYFCFDTDILDLSTNLHIVPYSIDYDYSNDIIQANYSMNNPLGCKWLIHVSQEYKNQILR